MSNSNRWSTASAPCRLDWRPSRWVTCALSVLGPIAALSVLFSEMPRAFAWPVAVLALGYGAWLAYRESRIPACRFVWRGDGRATRDGNSVEDLSLHWRGPLAFMQFRTAQGQTSRLSWWPDTLGWRERRELRLALEHQGASRRPPRMAG